LEVSFIRPHSPYDPPARCLDRYAEADIPAAVAGEWARRYIPPSDASYDIWHGCLDAETIRQSRRAYYASVRFVDEQVGRILGTLEQGGLLDHTLIVFLSDHGDMLGDQNLWRKTYAYEPSARIPLLMRWPEGFMNARRGQVRSEPVEIRDILPTLLDTAGKDIDRKVDGASLLSLVRGSGPTWREWIDLEHNICYSPENHWNALTDGKWKFIFHAQNGAEQLFHLEEDPHELRDLGRNPDYQGTVRRWRGRLMDHLSERGEEFVRNGRLVARPQGMMVSPHFPGYEKAVG
jgi:arylsulfatase